MSQLSYEVKQYLIVTGNYWAFTLTDGALRMLVVLYFHQLGYSPLSIAMLFLFYEFFGVVTNLVGGWLGARIGLNKTMNIGLLMQVAALALLAVPSDWLSVAYVMFAQALSGIAKDLNKMSAKSAVKFLVAKGEEGTLFKWVAVLTGSKNALKGVGFFMGGLLLTLLGFMESMIVMAIALAVIWGFSLFALKSDLGKSKNKPKFTSLFSKSSDINYLSAARLFLFGARDVWFVVALPVYLSQVVGWSHWWVGAFLASWIIGYGAVQSMAPAIVKRNKAKQPAVFWSGVLAVVPAAIALLMSTQTHSAWILIVGLLVFGVLFAINSSLHSYLVVSLANDNNVSMDVGFYYMANAMGRLLGTVLSGWIFQVYGMEACLYLSAVFIGSASLISLKLPHRTM